jgi:hypothetical protein
MCHKKSLDIISKSVHGFVGFCSGCDKYNLTFENIFLVLKEEEVRGLGNFIDDEYGIYVMDAPIGHGKVIRLTTPFPNAYVAFNNSEFEEFKRLVNETVLMLDISKIIKVK